MNTNYLNEYTSLLEKLLSVSCFFKYSTDAVERNIAYSAFFGTIERSGMDYPPIIVDTMLVREVFVDLQIRTDLIPTYKQCSWAAESYLRIQNETGLTFEAIFLYMPITKMFDLFPIYHEMDFSQIVSEFKRIQKSKSILETIIDKYQYSLFNLSNKANISYETLYSFKKRRRDIKKANADVVAKLATVLRVRIETLIEFSF